MSKRKKVMSDIHISPTNVHDRQIWIDIFRGLSIILVIIGHLYIPAPLYRLIFSFHIYAFFFLSGVTWKSEKMVQTSVKKYAFNSFTHLLIPYLIYAFLWNVTDRVMQAYMTGNWGSSFVGLTKNLIYSFLGFGSTGPAWFLYCLLTTRTLYYFMTRLTPSRITKGCISGGLFLIGFLLNGKTFLPFHIIQSLTSVFSCIWESYIRVRIFLQQSSTSRIIVDVHKYSFRMWNLMLFLGTISKL